VIVVDSSVWIDLLRSRETNSVVKLQSMFDQEPLLVGDLVLCEVLQGLRDDAQARHVEQLLRQFVVVPLCDPDLATNAAANYRFLRSQGVTIRNTIDMIIGTFCIERGHTLLHSDRDFEPMERLLGLRTV
jgi:predicted nucleic acid-binding protein